MSCGLSTNPAGDQRTSVPSKPKLTLQTRCLPRTSGTSSTGLSFFASGANASPTVRNTFKNAYDVPAPSSATASPSKTPNKPSKPALSHVTNNHSSSSPYQLPLGVKSILRNSPLEPSSKRRSVSIAAPSGNSASATRRVFFPAKKQVIYRYPLEEEIQTVRYTARHSDLVLDPDPEPAKDSGSDNDSDSNSSLEQSDTGGSDDDAGTGCKRPSLGKLERKKRKQMSANRQIRAVALLDGLEGDSYAPSTPQTPQDRVKRRREWKWTLGSIDARNESLGFPRAPAKPPAPDPSILDPEIGVRSTEKETESSVSYDSDLASSVASRQLSSPTSSAASIGGCDESKST
ncbi:hypothetical protein PHISP_05420 [Aspergillus sp. HF37]|nr:hypothetical protein PHISP_05420 [Aspergillus sp. HF37]